MHDMIQAILVEKKKDLAVSKSQFLTLFAKGFVVIGEVKFASPSAGVLGSAKSLRQMTRGYEKAGADAISIITEKLFFKGDESFVIAAKKQTNLPILQKDFVIDAVQIAQAKMLGTDGLLLIARIVDGETLKKFVELCLLLDIEPVVEVHSEKDLAKALKTATRIIAVNARDLDTFAVDVDKACRLLQKVPKKYIRLGFSGIKSAKELEQYKDAGANGVLIGTALMQAKNPQLFLERIAV